MMYINGHWETVNTIEDIIKVIREQYNEELADRMEELYESMVDGFNNEIERLIDDIDYLKCRDCDFDDDDVYND